MITVVLAAGRGTRLDAAVPKPLAPVAGVPVIDRILAGLADDGFTDVVVVTGHRADEVESHVGEVAPTVRFNRQPEPAGTADALLAARQLVGEHGLLVTWGDVIVPAGTYRRTVDAAAGNDGALAINHLDDLAAGGAVSIDGDRVTGITEKPGPNPGWNLTGVLRLGSGIWEHASAAEPSVRGESELPEAIDTWIGSGASVAAVPVDGPVFEIGTPEALDAADAYFSGDTRDR